MTDTNHSFSDPAASVIVENLQVYYGVGPKRTRVLDSLSLMAAPGEVTAVAGRNGAGKTTLFRTLMGLHPPAGGTCRIGGQAPQAYRRSSGIGYVPHGVAPPRGWSGRTFLARGADLVHGSKTEAQAAFDQAVAATGFSEETLSKPLGHCSTGTLQRIYLSYAMIGRPKVVMLDEPFSGLDPVARIDLRARIGALASTGVTVLMASHDLSEVARLAHRVFLLSGGRAEEVQAQDFKEVDRLEHRLTEIGG